jgi:hypothetical protein
MSLSLARSTTWRRAPVAGIALAIALAATAKLGAVAISHLGQGTGVPVSAIVLAVLLGIAWRNTFGLSSRFEPGVQIVAQRVLRCGTRSSAFDSHSGMARWAGRDHRCVGCMLTAPRDRNLDGRLLGLPRLFVQLLALGTAACGCWPWLRPRRFRARPADTASR